MKPYNRNHHLRQFAFIFTGGLTLIFGIIGPLVRQHWAPNWLWILNSIIILIALINPKILDKPEKLWLRIGLVLGAINSRIILTIIFYGLFTPMAIAMRSKGRDILKRKMNLSLKSYRVTAKPRPGKHMLKPY
jgi:Saxitoxin biosynthesis operon protein SxtJ